MVSERRGANLPWSWVVSRSMPITPAERSARRARERAEEQEALVEAHRNGLDPNFACLRQRHTPFAASDSEVASTDSSSVAGDYSMATHSGDVSSNDSSSREESSRREVSEREEGQGTQGTPQGTHSSSVSGEARLLKRIEDLEAALASQQIEKMALDSKGSSSPRVTYKFRDPPKFSGNEDQDIREWLRIGMDYCKGTNCPDEQRLPLLVSYLDGKARKYWNSREMGLTLDGAKTLSIETFSEVMIAGFGNVDPIMVAWGKLEKLKQGAMSVEEYARVFENVCAELGTEGPSTADKIQRFKAGLHPDMKLKVASQADGTRWTDFRKLVSFASAIWSVIGKSVKPTSETGNPRTFQANGSKGKKRKFQGGSELASGDKQGKRPFEANKKAKGSSKKTGSGLKLSKEEKDTLFKENKCLYCKEVGHFARDCPKKAAGQEN